MAIRTYELTIVSEASTKKVQFALPDKLGMKYRIKLNLSDGKSIYAADPSSIIGAAKVIQNTGIAQTFKMKARLGTPSTPSQFWQTVDVGNFTTPGIARDLSLQDATWDDIAIASKSNIASTIWNIGDEKTITLSTDEEITVRIIGFNRDDLADGSGKAGITFEMKDCLKTTYEMAPADTNAYSWRDSTLRKNTVPLILGQFPEALQNVIQTVKKNTVAGNRNTSVITTEDTLFLLSPSEIYSRTGLENDVMAQIHNYVDEILADGGTQYDYYKNKIGNIPVSYVQSDGYEELYTYLVKNRLQYVIFQGEVMRPTEWWLRSPSATSRTGYYRISEDGESWTTYEGNYKFGVSFCFCV